MNFHVSWKTPSFLMLVGLAVRESLSFWTGHPFDFEVWLRNAAYVSQGASPYSSFPSVPGISFEFLDRSIGSVGYPPLWPLVIAGIFDGYRLLSIDNRFVLYFLLKQPVVIGDVLLGLSMYRAVLAWGGTRDAAVRALRFWCLFPYAIVISAIWGQFDALIALLWLTFLSTSSQVKRGLFLGFSLLLKVLPIIFAPYLLLRERGRSRAAVLAGIALPVGLTGVIFLLTGWSLTPLLGTLGSNVQGSVVAGMTYMNLFVDPGVHSALNSYGLFYIALRHIWIPAVLLASWFAYRRFPKREPADSIQASIFLLVVFFLTRWGVNEQLLISLFPLLVVDGILWHQERRWLWLSLILVASAFLLVETYALVLFVGPVYSGVIDAILAARQTWGLDWVLRTSLQALGLLFTILLIQSAIVVADPTRGSTPWLARVLQRVWSPLSSYGRGM